MGIADRSSAQRPRSGGVPACGCEVLAAVLRDGMASWSISRKLVPESPLTLVLLGAAQPIGVQPVADGVPVDAQLVGDLDERPRPLSHAVSQVGLQAGKARAARPARSGDGRWPGGADGRRGSSARSDGCRPRQGGGGSHQSWCAAHWRAGSGWRRFGCVPRGSCAGRGSRGVGTVVQAALLAVDHCEAALEHQAAGQTGCWWCFPCAWSAGSPTTPGDPNSRSHLQ